MKSKNPWKAHQAISPARIAKPAFVRGCFARRGKIYIEHPCGTIWLVLTTSVPGNQGAADYINDYLQDVVDAYNEKFVLPQRGQPPAV